MPDPDWKKVPTVTKVITVPTMRPDGSLLQKPGHVDATGVLYKPSTDFPHIEESPSLDTCRECAKALVEVVRDFPFAGASASLSVWMAGLFTCVARSAIEGPTPLFAVTANTFGTGKTRLAATASQIAFGHEPVCFPPPPDESTFEERITLAVDNDIPFCLIDNVSRHLQSPALSGALTAREWSYRVLGSSHHKTRPMRTVWWAAGNHLSMDEDIARRTLAIQLSSTKEHDERNDFVHRDLSSWVKREQPRLITCALTIVRGYIVADRPGRTTQWGSFESWSALIPGILTWLGYADPMTMRWQKVSQRQ